MFLLVYAEIAVIICCDGEVFLLVWYCEHGTARCSGGEL